VIFDEPVRRSIPSSWFATLRSPGPEDRAVRLTAAVIVLLLAVSLTAGAQPAGKVWHIAHLSLAERPGRHHLVFEEAMKALGYVEGQNLVLERRFLGQRVERLDEALQDVVRLRVDAIVAWAAPLAAAAKRATTTIPVVFVGVRAPVERGLVSSLARPGGNLTGVSTFPVETIDPKLLELARELVPHLSRVAVLRSSVDPPGAVESQATAARALGLKLAPIPFSDERDVSNLPAAIERSGAQVLVAPDTPLLFSHRKQIVDLAAKRRLPVVYAFREAVEEGGLMALSTDFSESARRAAVYVDRIFKGARPADIPVEQPTKLEFVINARTARALGLPLPPSLLLRADHVIE
jgi:putative ABC transport system substrate-binding protein